MIPDRTVFRMVSIVTAMVAFFAFAKIVSIAVAWYMAAASVLLGILVMENLWIR